MARRPRRLLRTVDLRPQERAPAAHGLRQMLAEQKSQWRTPRACVFGGAVRSERARVFVRGIVGSVQSAPLSGDALPVHGKKWGEVPPPMPCS
jgi:hypothetical protein